jgi:ferrous iron transport protein B
MTEEPTNLPSGGSIALVGHPNVGKSVIFQRLTGQRVIVANYPGTTVVVTRGTARDFPDTTVVDTPGVLTLPPHTEDERVTARVLVQEPLKAILQVGDAKNLRRTLLLTVQLAEMGRPLVVALNMMDEADSLGIGIDHQLLADYLSVPVVPTTAVHGVGINELTQAIQSATLPQFRLNYPREIERSVAEAIHLLPAAPISARALALLWLGSDTISEAYIQSQVDPSAFDELKSRRERLQISFVDSLGLVIQNTRLKYVERIAAETKWESAASWNGISATLGRLALHPIWGWGILLGVLYFLYWFIGVFGAGTLVDYLEGALFEQQINPWVIGWVEKLIPIPLLAEFIIGDFGLWTVGITYAFALILPIVTTFFLAFGIMEDSGYLPRLAALSNKAFRLLGLNGKAVLPMILGLGCVTMATLTTRVLESKRERFLVTLLLALAVPCSAQLGVVMGMLASISFGATLIWSGVIVVVLLVVGWLAAKLVPGERSTLLLELPPMRMPQFSNVVLKTLARLEWYLKEVVPLFLVGAAVMFLFDKTGILSGLGSTMEPLIVQWLGLPVEATTAFLMGFLRRDFGASGLFVMESQGLLSAAQVVVSMVAITLFIPCVATVIVIAKERGNRAAAAMVVLVFPLAFFVAGVLSRILIFTGWGL